MGMYFGSPAPNTQTALTEPVTLVRFNGLQAPFQKLTGSVPYPPTEPNQSNYTSSYEFVFKTTCWTTLGLKSIIQV